MPCADVVVILPLNLYSAPFYYKYEKILNEMNISFDLILWNRTSINEISSGKIICYNVKDVPNNKNPMKVLNFFGFSYFVKKQLQKNKYKKMIFLSTYAGNASLISNYLRKKYYKKYWLDIRDYTYEYFKPYYICLKKTIYNSYATAISSQGYMKFLPKYDYIITHNINKENIKEIPNIVSKAPKQIRISFIGNVRYYEINFILLNIFKNDDRFLLQYYGEGSEKLKQFCLINDIKNVDFYDRFNSIKTPEFYNKTDIINNVYGNSGIELTTALSNKLYYAIALKKPILVSSDTYMEEISTKIGLGFPIDFKKKNIPNSLYAWYLKFIENKEIIKQCSKYLNDIEKDEIKFKLSLTEFLKI